MISLQLEVRGPCDVDNLKECVIFYLGDRVQIREGVFGDVVVQGETISCVLVPTFIEWLSESGLSWKLKMVPTALSVSNSR